MTARKIIERRHCRAFPPTPELPPDMRRAFYLLGLQLVKQKLAACDAADWRMAG
jgi:hypothetical protein